MRKKIVSVLCAAVLSAAFLAGCGTDKAEEKNTDTKQETQAGKDSSKAEKVEDTQEEDLFGDDTASLTEEDMNDLAGDELLSGKHHAEIVIKDYGTIEVELDADTAPITVTNFVDLAKSGFYDGLTFHRIMKDFMMQGGDPKGDGTGGSGENIKGEFEQNGVKNEISHKRGVISMARSNDFDSASSQFFIMHADSPHLDGAYAAFGQVTEGMDVVDQVCEKANPVDNNGTIPSEEQPVIETIKVID